MEDKAQTKDVWIETPDGRIFARSWTPSNLGESKSPILLFHDSLGCIQLWRDFPELLANATGRVVFAYDRLGFGKSDKRMEPALPDFIDEEAGVYFPIICRELKIDRAVLFGHSVGGAMAITCASLFPERCERVITEAAQAFVEDRTLEGISIAKKNFESPSEFARLEKYHGEKALWVLKAWTEVWLSKEFSNWSLKEALPKVQCSVLALHGDKDEFGSRKFPEMIADLSGGPSEMKLLENCGHVPHKEQTQSVLKEVCRFIGGTKS